MITSCKDLLSVGTAEEVVKAMMNHPALYAYHLKDEPEVNDLPGLGELVKKIKTIDSHHHDACHKQAADNTTDHLLASLPCDDTSCDAYSNTPILSGYTAPMLMDDTSTVTSLNSSFISFVPEQPQHPPLANSL